MNKPIRVVQWTTGKVASEAVKAILERPQLELVGVYAYSADKVGMDVGELCDLGRAVGVTATNDIDAIVALEPDCVLYMPLHPDVDHLTTLLRAGINVATTAHFMTGRAYGAEARAAIEAAALEGGASMFGSGINPGYAQYLAAIATNVCRTASYVSILESFDIGTWAGDANQDELGWGRPAGDPGHAASAQQATIPFGDTCEALGDLLGLAIDDVRCEVEFAHATRDLDIPGRDVRAGTVAGICARWIGSVDGTDVVESGVRWTITPHVTPRWDIAMAYEMNVRGYPNVSIRAEVLPEFGSMGMDEMMRVGSVITAMPVVNAVPGVVAARPGIIGYRNLGAVGTQLLPAEGPVAQAPTRDASVFTRESTLRDLSSTPVGRLVSRIVTAKAKSAAADDRAAAMFVDMAGYMSLEKLVRMSDGKLTLPMVDSVVDIANGHPGRVLTRVGVAGRQSMSRGVRALRARI